MSRFPWHPVDLSLKLALAPHSWFDPLLEWYTPAGDFSRGTYFGLARWRNAGSAGGYVATQNWKGEFRECEFPLEELEALEKTGDFDPARFKRLRVRWFARVDSGLPRFGQ